jgi:hypothetical protein
LALAKPAVAAREPEVPSGIERDKTGTASHWRIVSTFSIVLTY